ncbi:MAG TPA: FG-GAP repeat protein [Candidatus Thermoplasmatota archaeon]|nr:FG-GAP repeat protein [Candidatus Thermoplasmatota archaeon]
MNKKLIGVLICTLFIATAVPAVKSLNIREMIPTVPNSIVQPCGRVAWNETQKLLASDGAAEDVFGSSVSLDGDTLLIGASYDDDKGSNSGSAYVFIRNGTTWIQQAKLLASDGAAGDAFGYSVSLSGDTALIGAVADNDNMGSVYVFIRTHTIWTQEQKLLASDGVAEDNFGFVSLVGDTALIGAPMDDDNGKDSGSAYVFTRTGTWKEEAKLLASDGEAYDYFGGSVCLDGGTVLIGAYQDDDSGVDSGAAYVFTRNDDLWVQQAKLLPANGAAMDHFGWSVSLFGSTALIGAPLDDDNGPDSGSAYVFARQDTNWTQRQKLVPSDGSGFGLSVSQDEDYALIGAPQSQSAYIYRRTGTTWPLETNLVPSDGGSSLHYFGQSVSISGEIAVIGAPWDDDNGFRSGSVYMFESLYASYDLDFEIQGGIGIKLKITNTGTVNVTDVYWQIHVAGGILGRINKTIDGTIDILIDETKTVKSGMFFGFGSLSISAQVRHEEKIADGKQLIIFSVVN